MVKRLPDEYAENMKKTDISSQEENQARKAFVVSNINKNLLGKAFIEDFGKEDYDNLISDNPEHNSLEVHTDERGNLKGVYFVA